MSEILKKPYKITLWKDRNVYIVNGERKYFIEENDIVQNQWLEEVCIATIGSNTMDSLVRAFDPVLTEELNGSKIFTFTMYSRYWDDEAEEFKDNPFIKLLVNERKVKLKYDTEWYDFVIKQIQENSENYMYTYTCRDLFINELGKTGYEIELNTELQNNMGTVVQLANSILEGTDWQVDEDNTELLIQRNKESLYIYELQNTITATDMLTDTDLTILAGQFIYIFYSCKANRESNLQFLYVPGQVTTVDEAKKLYKIDEDGFITNSSNWQWTITGNIEDFYDNVKVPAQYFGNKIIQRQEMKYIPEIGETCTVWINNQDEKEYYCYTELEYASVAEIQNMLSNSEDFITSNGWSAVSDNDFVTVDSNAANLGNTYYTTLPGSGMASTVNPKASGYYEVINGKYTLTEDTNPNSSKTYYSAKIQRTLKIIGSVRNSGFYDNRGILAPNGFILGEPYTFVIKTSPQLSLQISVIAKHREGASKDKTIFSASGAGTNGTGILSGYKVFNLTCQNTISYQTLVADYSNIIFTLSVGNNTIQLFDIKFFKTRYDGEGNLIVPDLQTDSNSIIKTRYNFFPVDTDLSNVFGKDYLPISYTNLNTVGYTPIMVEDYAKVTSITGSKSNRFNLIQSLCEAFECWAKFTIEHDEIGRIIYEYIPLLDESDFKVGARYYIKGSGTSTKEDSNFTIVSEPVRSNWSDYYRKSYHKYVIFKEYIGDDNFVGFRYGINLKSIQRNIISDQIASKVIVQPNTNEFAPNGSCTIQQAFLNPTGENALYNFQYFINHGLLDERSLYDDLYGTNGGVGLYINLKEWNLEAAPLIEELANLGITLNTLESRQIIYSTLYDEAVKLRDEAIKELASAGYAGVAANANVNDYIKSLAQKRDSYSSTIYHYNDEKERNGSLLNSYRIKYINRAEILEAITNKKQALVNDFQKKYFSFIQEGTWTSSDYWNPDLYFQAANMVLYTSSFPQVSYTINVLELSEIEGFKNYKFKIADKTYIEDIEFFGYDREKRPYKEEIVISQIKYNLDDPSQNTITVRNYKTQFQDLFQRIAATSQSLQYNEGAYNRAASAVNGDGTINSVLLQNSLRNNELVIKNAKNQSVTWDDTGITISNFKNANEIVRLTSGGIVLTNDGGQSWTTGITGNGINADVVTTGRLDTNRIRIFNSNMQQSFEWNDKGINAFMWEGLRESGTVNYGQFVRFDRYGLYGYKGGDANWDPDIADSGVVGISKVIRDSTFSLTWKGLHFNLPSGQNFEIVVNPSGNPKTQGWYEYDTTNNNYKLTSDTSIQTGKNYYTNNDTVININDKFKVDGAGNVTATNGVFSGTIYATDGSFSGNITATTGRFYGDVYLGDSGSTTLQATLTKINNTATQASNAATAATNASNAATAASQTATTASQTATVASQAATQAVQGLAAKLDKNGGAGYGYINYAYGSGTDYDGYGVAIIATNTSGNEVSNIKATRNGAGMKSGSSQIYVLNSGYARLISSRIEATAGNYSLYTTTNGIYFHISDTWYRLGINNGYFVALSESP